MRAARRSEREMPLNAFAEYAAGALPPAQQFMVMCQRDICPEARAQIEFSESVAAAYLTDGPSIPLSGDFMSRALRGLSDAAPIEPEKMRAAPAANDALPPALARYLGTDLNAVSWKFLAPGMKSAALADLGEGQRLWLLRAKGGVTMPEHSHAGEEWALILEGSYHVGDQQYCRGDLHIEDETCTHIPKVDPGKDCICLVLTHGPLRPKALLPRLLMPLMGV